MSDHQRPTKPYGPDPYAQNANAENSNAQNPFAAPKMPYAHPASHPTQQPVHGLWRVGKVIHASHGAHFPPRCVKCNAPVERMMFKKFSWHNRLLALTVLVSPLVYIILAILLQKKSTFSIGVCDLHRARRRNILLFAWLVVVPLLVALFVCGFYFENPLFVICSLIFAVIAAIVFSILIRTIYPSHIDDFRSLFKGANPEFLNSLPTHFGN